MALAVRGNVRAGDESDAENSALDELRARIDALEQQGVSPDAIRQGLSQGQSLNDIAQANGVDPSSVDAAVKSALQQKLPNASDDQLQQITDRITNQQRTPPVDPNAEVMSASSFPQIIQA